MQAYEVIATMDDKPLLSLVYSRLGVTYGQLCLIEECLDCLTKALEIAKTMKSNRKLACDYVNLAIVLAEFENYPKAVEIFNKAMTYAKKDTDEYMQAAILSNISRCYRMQGDYKVSLQYALYGLKIAEKNNDTQNMLTTYHNIAASSLKLKRFEDAEKYANKCLAVASDNVITPMKIRAELLRADIKLQQEKYDEAKDILLNIEKMPALKNDVESIYIYYDLIQKTYEVLAEYKNACNILKKLLDFEREQAGAKLKAKLETQELKIRIGIRSEE